MLIQILIILLAIRTLLAFRLYFNERNRKNVRTIIILGSGGHTAEMLTLLGNFDLSVYSPRHYIVAATDTMSGQKADTFETTATASMGSSRPAADTGTRIMRETRKSLRVRKESVSQNVHSNKESLPSCYSLVKIPRSREVGQSFRSSIWTTLRAAFYAARAVFTFHPDLVLTNGPGTAVPVVAAALFARVLSVSSAKVIYVESIARVWNLSLTGKILYYLRLTDVFFVQWEQLLESHPKAVYAGRLM